MLAKKWFKVLFLILIGLILVANIIILYRVYNLFNQGRNNLKNSENSIAFTNEYGTTMQYESSDTTEHSDDVFGYNMVVYVTQQEDEPHHRIFRDYSINNNYELYGARESYGEKEFSVFVTAKQLKSAKVYYPNEFVNETESKAVTGYNRSSQCAYFIPIPLDSNGRYYPLFISNSSSTEKKQSSSPVWKSYNGTCRMTSKDFMPETDCNYTVLNEIVCSCVGINFNYKVTDLWNGNCDGLRYIKIYSEEYGWEKINATFNYSSSDNEVNVIAEWNYPVTLLAFGSARINPDGSSFNFYHDLNSVKTIVQKVQ